MPWSVIKKGTRGKYATCTDSERARIGRYAAEKGTTQACRHFSEVFKKNVPETTVGQLKNEET
jgi:hypothetical protein